VQIFWGKANVILDAVKNLLSDAMSAKEQGMKILTPGRILRMTDF